MTRVIGLGAGGHAKVMIETLRLAGGFDIVGLLDSRGELHGTRVCGVVVIGDDGLLPQLVNNGVRHAFLGVGGANRPAGRISLYDRLRSAGLDVITVRHPGAMIASSVTIGPGATIMAGVIVNAESKIGCNVILNTGAIVEHDCVIGDHVHIAPGSRLGGGVHIGEATLVGMTAAILPGMSVGRRAVVGAGAVVTADVADDTVVIGVPARRVRATVGE